MTALGSSPASSSTWVVIEEVVVLPWVPLMPMQLEKIRLMAPSTLGLVNKLLGTLLGIAKYFIMVCVLLMIVDALNDKFHFISEETRENSLLFDPFLNFAQQMYNTIRF